jgi:hypothetical protein
MVTCNKFKIIIYCDNTTLIVFLKCFLLENILKYIFLKKKNLFLTSEALKKFENTKIILI